jgi:hypothetical protein
VSLICSGRSLFPSPLRISTALVTQASDLDKVFDTFTKLSKSRTLEVVKANGESQQKCSMQSPSNAVVDVRAAGKIFIITLTADSYISLLFS